MLSWLEIHCNRVEGSLTPVWRSLGSILTRIYIDSYYTVLGHGVSRIISVPNLVKHCVNLYRIDVGELDNEIADVLVTLGNRIRILGVEDEYFCNIA